MSPVGLLVRVFATLIAALLALSTAGGGAATAAPGATPARGTTAATGATTATGATGATGTGAVATKAGSGVPQANAPVARPKASWTLNQFFSQTLTWKYTLCSEETQLMTEEAQQQLPGLVIECARVTAPLDWRNPTKGLITVQVTRAARMPAGAPGTTRTLFFNPGGPGVAAGEYTPVIAVLETAVLATHDIIGVDPRGTGLSTPVPCTFYPDGVADYRTPSAAEIKAQQNAAKKTVTACAAKHGVLLRQISTFNTVRDLDLVRALLKTPTIDFLGISAGTWLGSHYAQRFPGRVGRFVLDSNTQFTTSWRASFGWQPQGFQRRFDAQFITWVARHHADFGMGASTAAVRAAYATILRAAAARKLDTVTPNDVDTLVVSGLYTDDDFPSVASQLAAWFEDAQTSTTVTPRPTPETRVSAEDTTFVAVQCNDSSWSRSPSSYVAEGLAKGAKYPLIGYSWVSNFCAYWPYAPTTNPVPLGSAAMPELLMLQTELDPATPWEGASLDDRSHSRTRLLTVDDQGNHTAYLGANSCVEGAVNTFFNTGVLPAVGKVCAGLALPYDGNQVYPVSPRGDPISVARDGIKVVPRTDEIAGLAGKLRRAVVEGNSAQH